MKGSGGWRDTVETRSIASRSVRGLARRLSVWYVRLWRTRDDRKSGRGRRLGKTGDGWSFGATTEFGEFSVNFGRPVGRLVFGCHPGFLGDARRANGIRDLADGGLQTLSLRSSKSMLSFPPPSTATADVASSSCIRFFIQSVYMGTLTYTPGRLGVAHSTPQLTMPPTNHRSRCPSTGHRSGPPESPCVVTRKWKKLIIVAFRPLPSPPPVTAKNP